MVCVVLENIPPIFLKKYNCHRDNDGRAVRMEHPKTPKGREVILTKMLNVANGRTYTPIYDNI